MKRICFSIFLLLSGCEANIKAIFDIDEFKNQKEFLSVPFPNHLYMEEDGSIDLLSFFKVPEGSILENYLKTISKANWFGLNSAVYFRFDGEISEGTLPDPKDSLLTESSLIFINVDKNSPERGKPVPVLTKFFSRKTKFLPEYTLAVLPFPGFPLKENSTYSVFITKKLKGKGKEIRRSKFVEELINGKCQLKPEECEVYVEAIDVFEEFYGDKDDILNMTLFRTGKQTDLLRKLINSAKEEIPVVEDIIYKGIFNDKRHDIEGMYHLYEIHLKIGVFQNGSPPYLEEGGDIDFENLSPKRWEDGNAVLVLPDFQTPKDGYCVVLYGHGTGGDAYSFVRDGSALNIIKAGCAGIGFDEILNGKRCRNDIEPLLFFNPFNIRAARDNILQASSELAQMVSFIENFHENLPSTGEVFFDRNKIFYMGHSQGAIIGVPFLGIDERVKAGVISGGGGFLTYSLLYKSLPFEIRPLLELLIGEKIDEFHILLNLFQTYFEPADSVNYIGFITSTSPKHIFVSEGLLDEYTPPQTAEAMITAGGIPILEPVKKVNEGLEIKGIKPISTPVECNIKIENRCITGIAVQFENYGHFALFESPEGYRMWRKFIETAKEGIPSIP